MYVYGRIALGWEAHFRNYRHNVSQCPVSTLNWLPNFPHKAWVDPGEGSFTCQVNRCEWESNCDCLCSNDHDHYTKVPYPRGYLYRRNVSLQKFIFTTLKLEAQIYLSLRHNIWLNGKIKTSVNTAHPQIFLTDDKLKSFIS